jgi:bromodomain-containing protein 8
MDKVIKDEIRAVLARKFGKKLLDSWVPDEDAVKEALEAGPLSAEEVKAVEGQEGEVVIAEPEKGVAETEIATSQDKNVEGEDVKAESAVTENVDEQAVEQEPEKVEQPQAEVTDIEMDEPTKEASPAKDRVTPPPQTPIEVNSPAEKVRESGAMSPASDLSSAPDDNDQDRPSSPIKQTSSKGGRASKRKASMQPRGAPVSKRSTRRRTTATPGLAGEDSKADEDGAEAEDAGVVETPATEPEAETPVPVEEEVPRRGRRTTKRESVAGRGNKKATSPASSTRQSSPIAPKRGQSASSAHSATPATEERRSSRRGPKGRGMRDEVVSKSVREQSTAADSVKGDEEEVEEENEQEQKQETKPEAEEEEEERPAPRTSRRGRRNASPSPVKRDEEDGEEEEEEDRPSTRATRRTKDHTTPVPEKQKEVFTERKSTRRSTARGGKSPTLYNEVIVLTW